MISIIIPLMRVGNYEEKLEICIESLEKQTTDTEIIVSEHEPEKYIRKNYLLNKGFAKSKGEIIWHCDADYELEDKNILERMSKRLKEVIYPVFYSPWKKGYKIADGGPMVKREILGRYGMLDESSLGCNYVTFPFLKWCMENTDFEIARDFIVTHNLGRGGRINYDTRSRLKPIYKETIERSEYEVFDLQ